MNVCLYLFVSLHVISLLAVPYMTVDDYPGMYGLYFVCCSFMDFVAPLYYMTASQPYDSLLFLSYAMTTLITFPYDCICARPKLPCWHRIMHFLPV